MAPKRVLFTGGSGLAGKHVIEYLISKGHQVHNLDIKPYPGSGVHTLTTDLTDAGQTFDALSTPQFNMGEFALDSPLPSADAVVHFAAYPSPLIVPDNKLFSTNILAAYNVIEAACKLGIRKIVLASSITTYGVPYAQGEAEPAEYPCLEDSTDCNPTDSYALSKICMERIGRSFAARHTKGGKEVDIYALRIGMVVEPGSYRTKLQPIIDDPETKGKRVLWSYTDARDLGQIVERCLLKDGLGWQVFNAVNNSVTVTGESSSTKAVLDRYHPNVKRTRDFKGREAPVSNAKLCEVLGFREEFHFETELKREEEGDRDRR